MLAFVLFLGTNGARASGSFFLGILIPFLELDGELVDAVLPPALNNG